MILTTQEDHINLYRHLIVCIADKGNKIAKNLLQGGSCDTKELELLIALGNILCKFILPGTVIDSIEIREIDNQLTTEEVELLWDYISDKCELCLN